MKVLGLIGYPLTHSFSEKYFAEKFRNEKITGYHYRNFPIETIEKLQEVLEEKDLQGLNVTIPYKEQVMPFLDKIDSQAAKIGAVNTIKISEREGKRHLEGYNTDAYGFRESLLPHIKPYHKNALILGTGGASKAIQFVLDELGIGYKIVSRKAADGAISYLELCLTIVQRHQVIINTTPLGTYPDTGSFPDIPYDLLSEKHLLYDLVYNPPETKFMKLGKQKGANAVNGYEMLKLQAEKSWEIWSRES
jgi:shikimate dehydrogenase